MSTITRIDSTTAHDSETGARIHRTPRGWWVAVQTGMPTDSVRVGQGDSPDEAVADLSPTAIQSVGRDAGEADALEWASHQQGAGWRFARDADGWELLDASSTTRSLNGGTGGGWDAATGAIGASVEGGGE